MEGAVSRRYSSHFAKHGINSEYTGKASMYLVVLASLYTAGLWGTCYMFRPTHYVMQRLTWPRVQAVYAKVQARTIHGKGRAVLALGETIVLKAVLAPVAFPLRVWLAVKLANMSSDSEADDDMRKDKAKKLV
jgi:hypothetical protein